MRREMRREMEDEMKEEIQKELEKEREKAKEEAQESRLCTICIEREADIVFGCGHQACETCGGKLKVCHICRREIGKSRIKLFAT